MVEANYFELIVKDIMECVLSVIESVKEKIGTIYLVGGFGGCTHIFERLKEDMIKKFGSIDCRIIVIINNIVMKTLKMCPHWQESITNFLASD